MFLGRRAGREREWNVFQHGLVIWVTPESKPLLKNSCNTYPNSVFPTFLMTISWVLKVWSGTHILISIHQKSYDQISLINHVLVYFYSRFKIQSCFQFNRLEHGQKYFATYHCCRTESHNLLLVSSCLMNMNLDENISIICMNLNIH